MSERHIPGKLLGLTLAGTALLSCAGNNQVDGLAVVDCSKGPKNGDVTIQRANGVAFRLGGDRLGPSHGVTFVPQENNQIDIVEDNSWSTSTVSLVKNSDGTLLNLIDGPVTVTADGKLHYKDGNITYDIVSSEGESNTTKLEITATCDN